MAVTSHSRASNYDVFLSFRGSDTRYGFTGHLNKALRDKGIHTFIDDEELRGGDEIRAALVKAIQESRIAITVLSQDYASSSFCLEELATILDCKTEGLLVIPVFYKVDPSDVRHLKGSYEEAFKKHEKRFKDKNENMDKLQKWKMALRQVANLSGFHFKDDGEYEYEFIERIIKQVYREISPASCLHVADYPIGLKSKVQEVRRLLDVGSDDGVRMIGIHGMGGIGKSTLARAVYNHLIVENFDGLCFLENIREISNNQGLQHLQGILLSEILKEKDIHLTGKNQGISKIKSGLKGKKILLVLDDVDKPDQLHAIAGERNWFGPGSKIIITTRDKQLLESHQVNRTYEMNGLNKNDALQLLTWKAFKNEKVDPMYKEVLHRVVSYCSGLPLALEVIGSSLFGKSTKEWEHAIKRYKRILKKDILEILKVSFDALEEEEKSVFLDIACCFKGYNLSEVENILCARYDDSTEYHIRMLVEKSLLKIKYSYPYDIVTLHDLIEDMARQIELSREPGERKRLWSVKDIKQVLKDNTETNKIEIICLEDFFISDKEEAIEWNGKAFENMKNLQIVVIRNGKFSEGPSYFPESLRVLEWHRYPSNCLPSNFNPKELNMCKLPDSCFTSFEFDSSLKKFESLTVLKFDCCKFLRQIPDVSHLPNLEEFSFQKCGNLITVHDSISVLNKLRILNARDCSKLRSFPPLNLTSLEQFGLSYCSSLENFPEISGEMENIKELVLRGLPIKELPLSFQNLIGLQGLYMFECTRIVQLRRSIVMMPELSIFNAYDCMGWQWVKSEDGEEKVGEVVSSKLDHFAAEDCNLYDDFFSTGFMQLTHVRGLYLEKNNFTFLPECIKEFKFLSDLYVRECKHLQEIRGLPPNLKKLAAENCISLSSSSSSMLLNKELHKARNIIFSFPGTNIPEWFDQQSRGHSCSFWFRNKIPAKVLCILIAYSSKDYCKSVTPMMFINGKVHQEIRIPNSHFGFLESDHTYVFDLHEKLKSAIEVPLEKEWNHVEFRWTSCFVKAVGIHVFKQESSSMDDIEFSDPYKKGKSRNMSESNLCLICQLKAPETNAHEIDAIECIFIRKVWKALLKTNELEGFFEDKIGNWLQKHLSRYSTPLDEEWTIVFGITLYYLWRNRNNMTFSMFSFMKNVIVMQVRRIVMRTNHTLSMNDILQTSNVEQNDGQATIWRPPSFASFKLNCNGAVSDTGTAACGGIIRDHNGNVMVSFAHNLGSCSIIQTKLWAIAIGVKIAWDRGFTTLIVESDSVQSIVMVERGIEWSHESFLLVASIKEFVNKGGIYMWKHICQEANQVANALVKFGFSLSGKCEIFDVIPSFLLNVVLADITNFFCSGQTINFLL